MRTLNGINVTQHLRNFDLRTLFIEELGWDHGGTDADATVGNQNVHVAGHCTRTRHGGLSIRGGR